MFIDYKKISSKMQSNAKKPKIKTIKIQKNIKIAQKMQQIIKNIKSHCILLKKFNKNKIM